MTYWAAMGRYLGYPECSVTAFVERSCSVAPSAMQRVAGQGTGFIPYTTHAARVLSAPPRERWRRLCALITDRAHYSPFPRVNRPSLSVFKATYDHENPSPTVARDP